ncbi:hypothetical protein HDE_10416 [Halotydeus destructor]|nr:hypothetical protein HDE_10416 [Halotydeus destructor]
MRQYSSRRYTTNFSRKFVAPKNSMDARLDQGEGDAINATDKFDRTKMASRPQETSERYNSGSRGEDNSSKSSGTGTPEPTDMTKGALDSFKGDSNEHSTYRRGNQDRNWPKRQYNNYRQYNRPLRPRYPNNYPVQPIPYAVGQLFYSQDGSPYIFDGNYIHPLYMMPYAQPAYPYPVPLAPTIPGDYSQQVPIPPDNSQQVMTGYSMSPSASPSQGLMSSLAPISLPDHVNTEHVQAVQPNCPTSMIPQQTVFYQPGGFQVNYAQYAQPNAIMPQPMDTQQVDRPYVLTPNIVNPPVDYLHGPGYAVDGSAVAGAATYMPLYGQYQG